jgi:hypothetical protein
MDIFGELADNGLSGCSPVVVVCERKLGHFVGAMSLVHSICLRQFGSRILSHRVAIYDQATSDISSIS